MTATESAYAEQIASKLVDIMPIKISKLRPSHTFTYEFDSEDIKIFEEHPKIIERIYQRAISMACIKYWSEYKVRNITDETLRKQQIVKDNMSGRNVGLDKFNNIKVNIVLYPTTNLRLIGPKLEGDLIVFDARIMAVGGKESYVKSMFFSCPNDHDTDRTVDATDTLRLIIPKCPDCKVNMKPIYNTAKNSYVQTVKVQELDNSLSQAPLTLDIKVTGDSVFNTWIGKRVRISGHFLTDLDQVGKKHLHKHYVYSKLIHEIEEVANICIDNERALEIKELLKDKKNQDRLFKSFAPAIEGRLNIKESMCYAFVGGSKSEVRRIDINILDIGNAGEGKSETIKQIPRVISKSIYFQGNTATAAGLGIGMVKLDNQTSVPQGGPLVYCSPHGIVGIDELDKMHDEDQKALLSSMEQQVVTKVVAGTVLSLPSLVGIIAAANPKYGDWDESHGVVENINFPTYLLTRFDVVWCSVKTNDIKKQAIAAKILGMSAVTKEQELEVLLTEDELLQYINYCKVLTPKLTMDAKRMLNDFYLQMSQLTESEEKVISMTPRELEGMIRLSTARAKLLQRDEVGIEEVEAIIKLKKAAIESFPGVTLDGVGKQLMLMSEVDQKQKTKEEIIYACMDENELIDSTEVCEKWVDAGIFKTQANAERDFQNRVGDLFYLRGSKYKYR